MTRSCNGNSDEELEIFARTRRSQSEEKSVNKAKAQRQSHEVWCYWLNSFMDRSPLGGATPSDQMFVGETVVASCLAPWENRRSPCVAGLLANTGPEHLSELYENW